MNAPLIALSSRLRNTLFTAYNRILLATEVDAPDGPRPFAQQPFARHLGPFMANNGSLPCVANLQSQPGYCLGSQAYSAL